MKNKYFFIYFFILLQIIYADYKGTYSPERFEATKNHKYGTCIGMGALDLRKKSTYTIGMDKSFFSHLEKFKKEPIKLNLDGICQ